MISPRTRHTVPPEGLALLGAWLALSTAVAMAADKTSVTVVAKGNHGGAEIALTWLQPARAVAFRVEGTTLWLRFDQPLDDAPLNTLPRDLPEWITGVHYGYDTVLIEAAHPVNFAVGGEGNTVVISLTRVPAREDGDRNTAESQRIDRLRALTFLEQGEPDKARHLLEQLAADAPHDPSLTADLARVAESRGDWRSALDSYRLAAAAGAEGTEPVRQAAERLWQLHGPAVSLRTVTRDVQGADRQEVTSLDARALWEQRGTVGLHVEDRHLRINRIRRASGAIEPVDRHLGSAEMWVGHTWTDGAESRLGLLSNPDGTGFRMYHRTGGTMNWTEVELLYRQPYFDYVEGIADDGVRNRALLRNHDSVGPHIQTSLGVVANHYEIAGIEAGDSAGVDAALRYAPRPSLQIGYTLDAEYVDDVTVLPAPGGGVFRPLPITDRQVHSLGLSLSNRPARSLHWAATGGYARDVENENGAFAAVSVVWHVSSALEVTARAATAASSERGQGSRVREFGAALTWRPSFSRHGGQP